jgi:hypothetical protein
MEFKSPRWTENGNATAPLFVTSQGTNVNPGGKTGRSKSIGGLREDVILLLVEQGWLSANDELYKLMLTLPRFLRRLKGTHK